MAALPDACREEVLGYYVQLVRPGSTRAGLRALTRRIIAEFGHERAADAEEKARRAESVCRRELPGGLGRCWTRAPPGSWRAAGTSSRWCWAAPASRSMSAGRPGCSPGRYAPRSSCRTSTARFPAATGQRAGARRTTSSLVGRRAHHRSQRHPVVHAPPRRGPRQGLPRDHHRRRDRALGPDPRPDEQPATRQPHRRLSGSISRAVPDMHFHRNPLAQVWRDAMARVMWLTCGVPVQGTTGTQCCAVDEVSMYSGAGGGCLPSPSVKPRW